MFPVASRVAGCISAYLLLLQLDANNSDADIVINTSAAPTVCIMDIIYCVRAFV